MFISATSTRQRQAHDSIRYADMCPLDDWFVVITREHNGTNTQQHEWPTITPPARNHEYDNDRNDTHISNLT